MASLRRDGSQSATAPEVRDYRDVPAAISRFDPPTAYEACYPERRLALA
jgi:hypothetical protein